MIQDFHRMISAALGISERQISQTLGLLEDGATIPFISRYRKEVTGGLDEVQIESIKTHYEKLSETAKRKETILNTIQEQGKLTAELQKRIEETWDNTLLEDIYLPYKPKRKTRAEAARQKGLEPLATLLMLQREPHPEERAAGYVKGDVKNVEDALKGARDIIAEHVSEDERARNSVRNAFARQGILTAKVVKGKEEEATKYRDYFDCSESLKRCSSHRLLAIRRAEAEGLLKVSISRTMRSAWNAGTPIRAKQQRLRTASGRSRAGFLQTPIEAIHRDGICHAKQGARRRGSHQGICRKSPSVVAGFTTGAKACDGYRPRIPYGL